VRAATFPVSDPRADPGEVQLTVSGVSKHFGGVRAVEDVTLTVRCGELISIIGPNGAGKTSLLNMISGFYRPDTGSISFEGRDIIGTRPSGIAAMGIARTFQNIALFSGMTVLDNIMLGRHVHMKAGVLSSFVYWGLAQKEEVAHRARVEELIEILELEDLRKQLTSGLAYGLRKRVELARALALDPKLLLLDEPMGGMNQEEKEDMARFILETNQQWGTNDHPDRARHGGGDGHLGSRRRARSRPQDRRGQPRRSAAPPRRDHRLSRNRQGARRGRRMTATTLPRLLRRNAESMAVRPAMREKSHGIWQTFTWAQSWDQVRDFASGLSASGFRRGDKLAVIGDNRPRLYWAQLAAQCLGGAAVPMYQDSIATELVFVLNHAEVSVVVAEDQEQVDKILSLKDSLPHLELVVYDDPRGLRHYATAVLKSFDELQATGREFAVSHRGWVGAEIDKGDPDDLALLTYTSGTTGHPKGVMLSYANLLSSAQAFVEAEDIRATDELLCYLPMAWIGESLFSLVLTVLVGFTCNCPERPQTVQRDLRELGPTIAIAPPRIWENMLTLLRVRAADSTPFKRKVFEFFRGLAERAEVLKGEGKQTVCVCAARPPPWRSPRLRPGPRPAGFAPGALGLHRRRAARSRYLQILPLVRDQHKASLGLDRAFRPRLAATGQRGGSRHCGPDNSGDRGPDRRGR